MSEATTNHSDRTCDALLDYLYGELEGAGRAAFEAHLPGCARCQADVASFGKVRGAVKEVLPAVEPPPSTTGALHAQLMHAAASARPSRGKVLPLIRRVVSHPGYAAAASLLVIGGAVTWQLSRGALFRDASKMMAPEPAGQPSVGGAPTAPAIVPPSAAPEPAGGGEEPALAQAPAPPPITGHAAEPKSKMAKKELEGGKGSFKDAPPKVYLETDKGLLGVSRGSNEGADGRGSVTGDSRSTRGGPYFTGRVDTPMRKSAPVEVGRVAEKADDEFNGNAPSAAPAQSNGAATPRSAAVEERRTDKKRQLVGYDQAARPQSEAAKAQGGAAVQVAPLDPDAQKRLADELADKGRCEEADRVLSDLERRYPSLRSPVIRVSYLRCLRRIGRIDEAQLQLDELRRQKQPLNADLEFEQQQLDRARGQSKPGAKPAATSAPADANTTRRNVKKAW
jgi:hypothetical protein